MKAQVEKVAPTKTKLIVSASADELEQAKQAAVAKLGKDVRLAGFRAGTAPANLVEKNLDQATLQNEVLENVINRLYSQAAMDNKLRPVSQPEVSITKFVPFTTLEFNAEVEVVGDVKLGSYKTTKLEKPQANVSAKEVSDVLNNLNQQNAAREDADRAAKDGDEVTIDFKGSDAGTNQPIAGADGQDYPLLLGSDQFIPGFEKELVGLKAGESKEFSITFPSDYGVPSMQSKKVKFKASVKKVVAVKLAKMDDTWVAKISPFKSLAELKKDIKKQLAVEKQKELDQKYREDLLKKISDKASVEIPKTLVDDEIERLENDEKQNLAYRGQTFEEHLKAEGVSPEQHKEQKRETAAARVKSSLVLSDIADKENVNVTDEEINSRLALLREQHKDQQMRAELAKPEAKNQIANQLITEKTFEKLVEYASKPASK